MFARQKILKPLGHYLKATSKKPKAEGGAAVLAMMKRHAAKQAKGVSDG